MKKRIFDILSPSNTDTHISKVFNYGIQLLVVINVFTIILSTLKLSHALNITFTIIDTVIVAIFILEYSLRIWTADLLYPNLDRSAAIKKYMKTPLAIIDLVSIAPFFLSILLPINLNIFRLLRTIRILRLFKTGRYNKALNNIAIVFKSRASQLISSLFIVSLLIVISGVLMYEVEHFAQPSNFKNAFDGMWWAVATLTTVGYGDIYPVTVAGRVISSIIALLGIGLVAIPTGIISSGFIEQFEKDKEELSKQNYCQNCGEKLGK